MLSTEDVTKLMCHLVPMLYLPQFVLLDKSYKQSAFILFYYFFRVMCVEDMILPLQFKKKYLLIAQLVHQCGKFIVNFGENCPSLIPLSLCNLKNFVLEAVRDLSWVLVCGLGIPEVYLPNPVQS